MKPVKIGSHSVGPGEPIYVIGEIGINHNGDMDIVKKLIDVAAEAGCNAVKFQKRTPEICVPEDQKSVMRDTPWGRMSYLDYRYKVEFEDEGYGEIDVYARKKGIDWFASPWDTQAIEFLEKFNPVCYKVASASLTDDDLLQKLKQTGRSIILSTGMSTLDEIRHAIAQLDREHLVLTHTTSTYPCSNDEINLKMIKSLADEFDVPVGYSGHERGLQITLAAAALGACIIERHITLDHTMWGSDQAASVEPIGLKHLVRDVRVIEQAQGDGVKKVYDSELPIREKLRVVK